MPIVKLNKSCVDSILPHTGTGNQTIYRDSSLIGFGLRVTLAGAKSFVVEARLNGKLKRFTLGSYGRLTVEQARKEAQLLLSDIARGIDPIAERQGKQAKGTTLQDAFEDYLLTRKTLKASSIKDYRKSVEMYLKEWVNKPITEITKDMVELKHREIGKRSPSRANGTMRVLRAIFNHAMHKFEDAKGNPILTINPVARLSQNRAWYRVERRQTLLKAHELKPWYNATQQLNVEVTRDYLHFLLFTGLRRSEASHLTWANVDFKQRTFTIADTKNKQVHTLPFTDFIEELLQRRMSSSSSDWVFPSPVTDSFLVEPRTAIDRVTELSGIVFTCHDLRRTFITLAESLDIPAYALKRLLNHKDPNDVTAGYIVSNVDRLRKPMQKISAEISKWIQI